ncbi:MAG: hypothetical protein C5S38_05995 [Candidatus Methanophagaceae archaeon]|nr:MAG: hypothetical protein C5S38_05995 [Methanophagales archaeon]
MSSIVIAKNMQFSDLEDYREFSIKFSHYFF